MFDLDRDVVAQPRKLAVQRLHDSDRMPNAIEKIRIPKRDVPRPARHLLPHVFEHNFALHHAKIAFVHRHNRTVTAQTFAGQEKSPAPLGLPHEPHCHRRSAKAAPQAAPAPAQTRLPAASPLRARAGRPHSAAHTSQKNKYARVDSTRAPAPKVPSPAALPYASAHRTPRAPPPESPPPRAPAATNPGSRPHAHASAATPPAMPAQTAASPAHTSRSERPSSL